MGAQSQQDMLAALLAGISNLEKKEPKKTKQSQSALLRSSLNKPGKKVTAEDLFGMDFSLEEDKKKIEHDSLESAQEAIKKNQGRDVFFLDF